MHTLSDKQLHEHAVDITRMLKKSNTAKDIVKALNIHLNFCKHNNVEPFNFKCEIANLSPSTEPLNAD